MCFGVVAAEEVCVWEARDEKRKGVDGLALNFGLRPSKVFIFIIFLLCVLDSEKYTRELKNFLSPNVNLRVRVSHSLGEGRGLCCVIFRLLVTRFWAA